MKIFFRISVLVILFSTIFACDELLDKVLKPFESGPWEVDLSIDPLSKGEFFVSQNAVYHDINEQIEDKGGDLNELDEVIVTNADLEIVSGADNYNAIKNFDVYIKTPSNSEKLVASISEVPKDTKSISLSVTSEDIKGYFTEGEFTVIVKGELREDVKNKVDLLGTLTFKIDL